MKAGIHVDAMSLSLAPLPQTWVESGIRQLGPVEKCWQYGALATLHQVSEEWSVMYGGPDALHVKGCLVRYLKSLNTYGIGDLGEADSTAHLSNGLPPFALIGKSQMSNKEHAITGLYHLLDPTSKVLWSLYTSTVHPSE